MMGQDLKGKRLLKRLRLEAAIEQVEKDHQAHNMKGLVWVGVTKTSLQKAAGVGKNYIDLLGPEDDLAKRIKPLLRRAETTRVKRDVEETRLERIRELETQLSLQARENQDLMGQLNRTRSELARTQGRIADFERHFAAEMRTKPSLKLVEKTNTPAVVPFSLDEASDE